MEFPGDWTILDMEDFETASSPRNPGALGVDVLVQLRNSGRAMDEFPCVGRGLSTPQSWLRSQQRLPYHNGAGLDHLSRVLAVGHLPQEDHGLFRVDGRDQHGSRQRLGGHGCRRERVQRAACRLLQQARRQDILWSFAAMGHWSGSGQEAGTLSTVPARHFHLLGWKTYPTGVSSSSKI